MFDDMMQRVKCMGEERERKENGCVNGTGQKGMKWNGIESERKKGSEGEGM